MRRYRSAAEQHVFERGGPRHPLYILELATRGSKFCPQTSLLGYLLSEFPRQAISFRELAHASMQVKQVWISLQLAFVTAQAVPPKYSFTRTATARSLSCQRNVTEDANLSLGRPDETITYGCYGDETPMVDRDFYLNSVGLLHDLALKDRDGNEAAKVVNRDDARSVRITIGGTARGDQPMPRQRMIQILAEFVDAIGNDYGYYPITCDAFLGSTVQGSAIAHYEAQARSSSKHSPESKKFVWAKQQSRRTKHVQHSKTAKSNSERERHL